MEHGVGLAFGEQRTEALAVEQVERMQGERQPRKPRPLQRRVQPSRLEPWLPRRRLEALWAERPGLSPPGVLAPKPHPQAAKAARPARRLVSAASH